MSNKDISHSGNNNGEPEIRGLLKDTFERFEAEPEVDLWPLIEDEIQKKPANWRRKWYPFLAIAASIIILASMFFLLQEPAYERSYAEEPAIQQELEENLAIEEEANTHTAENLETKPDSPKVKRAKTRRKKKEVPSVKKEPVYMAVANPASSPLTAVPAFEEEIQANDKKKLDVKPFKKSDPVLSQEIASIPEPVSELPDITQKKANRKKPAPSGSKNTLDVDNLTLPGAFAFATEELSKWADSPINIYKEEKGDGEVKTYQFSLLDLTITRKTHKKSQKSQRL